MTLGNSIQLDPDEEEDEVINYWDQNNTADRLYSEGRRLPLQIMMPTSAINTESSEYKRVRSLNNAGYYGWRTQSWDEVSDTDTEETPFADSDYDNPNDQIIPIVPKTPVFKTDDSNDIKTDANATLETPQELPPDTTPQTTLTPSTTSEGSWTELPCIVTRSNSSIPSR
ncbi:uncharacterized protein I206_101926 [Kwoniella pini CBS 10737]|uniref:Uncharacterized protein n=1 Tax=Kwoniella pini CBS 10737 TaxID=1296096 RepID=A0A1B9HVA5_9TREE|nr:uncharacterized protein I206_06983 [Kwoniella pini CBS 10737]OCF47205.1 hypothetical protein I206_06983 [Kwoniella pini CBS 10737]